MRLPCLFCADEPCRKTGKCKNEQRYNFIFKVSMGLYGLIAVFIALALIFNWRV